jgi:hypothetical protein
MKQKKKKYRVKIDPKKGKIYFPRDQRIVASFLNNPTPYYETCYFGDNTDNSVYTLKQKTGDGYWTYVGTSPYLNGTEGTSYVYTSDVRGETGNFTFQDLTGSPIVTSVYLYVYCKTQYESIISRRNKILVEFVKLKYFGCNPNVVRDQKWVT